MGWSRVGEIKWLLHAQTHRAMVVYTNLHKIKPDQRTLSKIPQGTLNICKGDCDGNQSNKYIKTLKKKKQYMRYIVTTWLLMSRIP